MILSFATRTEKYHCMLKERITVIFSYKFESGIRNCRLIRISLNALFETVINTKQGNAIC